MGFEDIELAGAQQAIKDCCSLDENLWRQTQGPGMPHSPMREAWDKGYNSQKAIIVENNRMRLSILANKR